MKHSIQLYKEKRYKRISDNMVEVDKHNVFIKIRKGKKILLCDCENSTINADNNLCRHKEFFIILPFLEKLSKEIRNMKQFYETSKCMNSDIEYKKLCDFIIDDLKNLERLE